MNRLAKKIQISLFVFLGLCSLAINGGVFYILSDYHFRHYCELAEIHMEQQYQNAMHSLNVLGEQIRLFGENSLLINEVQEKRWSDVNDRITVFVQSSSVLESFGIYYNNEQGELQKYIWGHGNSYAKELEPNMVEAYWAKALNLGQNEIWFLKEGEKDGQECLCYLMPLQEGEKQVGFLLVDVNIDSSIKNLLQKDSLWQEHLAILSDDADWYSEEDHEQHYTLNILPQTETPQIINGKMVSAKNLTSMGEKMVQVISLDMFQILLPVGAAFLIIFLLSLVVIYFGIRMVTKTITVPMEEMQEKIKNTLHQ